MSSSLFLFCVSFDRFACSAERVPRAMECFNSTSARAQYIALQMRCVISCFHFALPLLLHNGHLTFFYCARMLLLCLKFVCSRLCIFYHPAKLSRELKIGAHYSNLLHYIIFHLRSLGQGVAVSLFRSMLIFLCCAILALVCSDREFSIYYDCLFLL